MTMINRLIVNAIGKFCDPILEDIETDPLKDPDYLFKVGIIFGEVTLYEEYVPNPEFPYYQYKGPLTKVYIMDEVRMCLISFEEFDAKYQEAMQLIPLRSN